MTQIPHSPLKDAGVRAQLDAESSPMHPAAAQTLRVAMEQAWADPGRLHAPGRQAGMLLDTARAAIASELGLAPDTISFHPSGNHALVTALTGLTWGRRRAGGDRDTPSPLASAIEHPRILENEPAPECIAVDAAGHVLTEAFSQALRSARPWVAVQHANAEIGTIQRLSTISARCREVGVPLLVDASASIGRVPFPARHADVVVGDARSWGGPAAIGICSVASGVRFRLPGPTRPTEQGREWAPVWVPLALAAAEALRQTMAVHVQEATEAAGLIQQIRDTLTHVEGVDIAGEHDPLSRLPHVISFSVLYVDGETIVRECDRRGFSVTSGSSCTSSRLGPSHVLAAVGGLTHGNVRVTLPLAAVEPHRVQYVDRFCHQLADIIDSCRRRVAGGA